MSQVLFGRSIVRDGYAAFAQGAGTHEHGTASAPATSRANAATYERRHSVCCALPAAKIAPTLKGCAKVLPTTGSILRELQRALLATVFRPSGLLAAALPTTGSNRWRRGRGCLPSSPEPNGRSSSGGPAPIRPEIETPSAGWLQRAVSDWVERCAGADNRAGREQW